MMKNRPLTQPLLRSTMEAKGMKFTQLIIKGGENNNRVGFISREALQNKIKRHRCEQ